MTRPGDALLQTPFAALPADLRDALVSPSEARSFTAGSTIFRDGDRPWAAVVLAGVLRVYIESSQGRQVTIRYVRIGGLIGIAGIMLEAPHVNIQALTAGVLQPLNAATLYEAYRSDVRVSWIALREIAGFLSDVIPLVAEAQFASVEHRIARHLLDLSTPGPDGVLVSTVTHQQLADAVGTVREVVVREVRSLREKGAIQTVPGGIAILDPDGLAAQAQVEHKSLHARLLPT